MVGSILHIHSELAANANRSVNISLTLRNWLIGCYIAEYELNGADRSGYGDKLLNTLSQALFEKQISNYNRRQLYDYLKFYRVYPQIVHTVSAQLTLPPQKLINIG